MTIWTPSTIRNRPGQSLEVHTMGAPVVYWIEVIKPGEPHNGQANTATKLGANASRRWANSSRKTMSPGAIPESDARSEICRSVGSGSSPAEFGTRSAPSRPGTRPNLRDLSWCFDTALRDPSCQNAGRKKRAFMAPFRPEGAAVSGSDCLPIGRTDKFSISKRARACVLRAETMLNRNFGPNSGKGIEVRIPG